MVGKGRKARGKTSKKRKFDLVSYVKKNRLNTAIAAVLLLFIIWVGLDYIQPNAEDTIEHVAMATTTLPKHIPGKIYLTSGEWPASKFGHDLGHKADDGSWQSEKNGFGYLIAGLYLDVLEGYYNVSFRIKIDNNTIQDTKKVVTIEVAQDRGITVVGKDLYVKDFAESNTYQDFILVLDTLDPLNDAEFRVHYDKSPATVNVERVKLTPIKLENTWYASDPALGHDLGSEDVNDSWTSGDGGFGYLISGPYISLKPGGYRVMFTMKVDNNQDSPDLGSIEVSKDRGTAVVSRKISPKDFGANDTYQDFTLNLKTEEYLKDVEFRVHYPKSTVKLTVEKIELKEEA